MEIFGVSKYISVPIAAIAVWLLIVKGNYKVVERVFLVASAIYLAYIASGVLAAPSWSEVSSGLRYTHLPSGCRLCNHICDHYWYHDCSLDAVLPAILHRRQRHSNQGLCL